MSCDAMHGTASRDDGSVRARRQPDATGRCVQDDGVRLDWIGYVLPSDSHEIELLVLLAGR